MSNKLNKAIKICDVIFVICAITLAIVHCHIIYNDPRDIYNIAGEFLWAGDWFTTAYVSTHLILVCAVLRTILTLVKKLR